MKLFAIGDLHFGTAVNKPMDVFGSNWAGHDEKIIDDWKKRVSEEDTVLLLGDTSWGLSIEEAKHDLDIIDSLPGRKIFIKGNHDFWWSTVKKMNSMYDNMYFMGTDFYSFEDIAICGGRGWVCPNDICFTEEDEKIYKREVNRIELSIKAAKKAGFERIIVIMHYPPTNDKSEPSDFTRLFEREGVEQVYYGHLHGEESFDASLSSFENGIKYKLISSDSLDFKLYQIKNGLNFCCDIDGTITSPCYFLPFLNELMGTDLKEEDYISTDWAVLFGEDKREIFDEFDERYPESYDYADLLPNADKVINKLAEDNNFSFVSARKACLEERTNKWLERHNLGDIRVYLLGNNNKVQIAEMLRCDYFFEDHPKNAMKLAKAGYKVILMQTRYNCQLTHPNIIKVKNWDEVEKLDLKKEGEYSDENKGVREEV